MKLPNVKQQYRWAVRRRLRIVVYVEAHSLLGASQHFGLDRKTLREWRDRYRAEGLAGLVPRYPAQRPSRLAPETIALLEHARRELEYGGARTRVWLRRVHQIHLPMSSCSTVASRWCYSQAVRSARGGVVSLIYSSDVTGSGFTRVGIST
jgi:transposase